MELTPEEIETVRHLISDWGFEYGLKADSKKVFELDKKIGPMEFAERHKHFCED